MERWFQWDARRGLHKQAIPVSLLAGAAILSSVTLRARGTTCSSRVTISSLTKMCAASFLKYLTLLWGQKMWACGRARLRQVMATGSKRSAEPDLRKQSYLSKKEIHTSEVNRRTMNVSLPLSPTRWSTQGD